ncbi:MAG TPA: hypothetical protein VI197_25480, partial [Polyangiaceae bacterium]
MPPPHLRKLAALFACLALVALTPSKTTAHELAIDQVSLWPDLAARQLRGQVSFDPELTRELDAPIGRERAEQRAIEFVQRNLTLLLNDRECTATVEVRELYTRGGAVPGDIVMLSCPRPSRLAELAVRVCPALRTVV